MNTQAYFARHAQTLVGSLGRLAGQPFATLMTMGVVAVALALPLFLNLLMTNVRAATEHWSEAYDLSVYLDQKAGAGHAAAKQLRLRRDVAQVRVITADEALAEFRKDSGFGAALDALRDNPLPDTLIVTPTLAASTPQGTEALKAAIAAMPQVQAVQIDTQWIQRLHAMLDVLRRVVALTATLLGLGVILIIGNTVRLDILNRRTEIEVMKLVGASNGFARRPFLYSGIWYGLGGGMIAALLTGIAAAMLARPVDVLAALYGSGFHLQGLSFAAGAQMLFIAMSLAWVGAWLAATRHIRRMDAI